MGEGEKKLRARVAELKKDKENEEVQERNNMEAALVTLDSLKKSNQNVGMNNIGVEDIMPPKMFLVQGIKDKSELVDNNGNECPDGKFFIKGLNEIVDSVEGSFIWVKRDEYKKEGNQWSGSKMYRTIFVRSSDMLCISVDFSKSNVNALADLFTSKVTKKLPLFVFKTEIGKMIAQNKDGIQFFKMIVKVKGIEEGSVELTALNTIAERFDQKTDLQEEVIENSANNQVGDQQLHENVEEAFGSGDVTF